MASSLSNVRSRGGLAETVERVRAAAGQNPEQFARRLMAENPDIPAIVRQCCDSSSLLTLALSTTAALPTTLTVNNVGVTVEKE